MIVVVSDEAWDVDEAYCDQQCTDVVTLKRAPRQLVLRRPVEPVTVLQRVVRSAALRTEAYVILRDEEGLALYP